MTFEEFFKKKKIDLDLLKAAEPVLFAEFESHYQQMGEKSFDHTKKYWFNQLRRTYHTPEEIKVEKVKVENPLAEQTITESITEKVETPPAPKVGFTPRFKAGATKPAGEVAPDAPAVVGVITNNPAPEANSITAEEAPKPKVGFTPRFKAGVTKTTEVPVNPEPTPAAVVGVVTSNSEPEIKAEEPATEEEAPAPKLGFKPKFKAGITKPKQEEGE